MGWLSEQEAEILYKALPEAPLYYMTPEEQALADELVAIGLMFVCWEGFLKLYEPSSAGRALLLLQRIWERAQL